MWLVNAHSVNSSMVFLKTRAYSTISRWCSPWCSFLGEEAYTRTLPNTNALLPQSHLAVPLSTRYTRVHHKSSAAHEGLFSCESGVLATGDAAGRPSRRQNPQAKSAGKIIPCTPWRSAPGCHRSSSPPA